jgi:adenosine 3'-phospho 5'-phosphosulfate transporter B3
MSLNYINFPTKVVFRSCKLIPTMLIATLWNKRIFSAMEYACAIAISVGLILFAAADWQLTPSFNLLGILLVTLSVCADAILPNAQERIFATGAGRLEVMVYSNFFTFLVLTITTAMSGDLMGVIHYSQHNQQFTLYLSVYTVVAYIAISCHMMVVKRFGGVAAVLVATARKGMTLVLSFVLFPKAFSWYYVVGAILVLGGLLVASLVKMNAKTKTKSTSTTTMTPHHQTPAEKHAQLELARKVSDMGRISPQKNGRTNIDLEAPASPPTMHHRHPIQSS